MSWESMRNLASGRWAVMGLVVAACSGPGSPDDTGKDGPGDTGDTGCAQPTTWYTDADADGHGDPATATEACEAPEGAVDAGGDCDDAEPEAFPGNTEVCDYVDNDCDEEVDEPDATDAATWYEDRDGDDHGDPASFVTSCTAPSGYAGTGDDCDDDDGSAYPGGAEVCGDGVDQDCVGGDLPCT